MTTGDIKAAPDAGLGTPWTLAKKDLLVVRLRVVCSLCCDMGQFRARGFARARRCSSILDWPTLLHLPQKGNPPLKLLHGTVKYRGSLNEWTVLDCIRISQVASLAISKAEEKETMW